MSRMERYYKNNYNENKRSRMNQDLYRTIYEADEYSNIEGIATMDKTNEIDLTKIKGMLKSREDYNSQKEYRSLFKNRAVEEEIIEEDEEIEEKNFDIRDILEKVKNQKQDDEKYRSIDNTNYNLLKELKIKERKKEIENNEEELKELVNTLTNTSMLNSMNDSELSLSLFDDLKASEKTLANSKSIQKILDEAKKEQTTEQMSNSFYTKSLNFSKKDMEEYASSKEAKRSLRKIKILVTFIVLVVLIAIGVMIYNVAF